jgi:hypothetical protein
VDNSAFVLGSLILAGLYQGRYVLNKLPKSDTAATILSGVRKNRGRILIGRDAKLVDLIARLFPQSYGRIMAWLGPKEQDIY